MKLKQYKKELLNKNTEFAKEYQSYDLPFEISQMLIEARTIKGITQQQLAEMIDTKQSGVARAESGKYLPSLSFLNKIATALKTHLVVGFGFMSELSFYNKTATYSANEIFVTANEERINNSKIRQVSFYQKSNPSESDVFTRSYVQ